jgi:hypothetical protein
MNTVSFSLPHPVLGLGDDIDGAFSIEIQVKRDPAKRCMEFHITNLEVTNKYVSAHLREQRFGIVFKVYCSSTFKTWSFLNPIGLFTIPEDELANKVEIEAFIVALQPFATYADKSFNPDFEGEIFSLGKFDIVGTVGKIIVPIEKKYEKLSIGNIFSFVPEESHLKPVSFDLNGDKIIVKYPVTATGAHPHNQLFNKSPWVTYNILIVPALTEAFRILSKAQEDKKSQEDMESIDTEWAYVLDSNLPVSERHNDPFVNAQLLLRQEIPLLLAYNELCPDHL